jgi:hypothetical protein
MAFRIRSARGWQRRSVRQRRLLGSIAAAGLLLGGCGANSKPPGDRAAPAQTATAGTVTIPPTTGGRLRGADYAFDLAAGWTDTTSKRKNAAGVDRVVAVKLPRAVAVIAIVKATAGVGAARLLRDRRRAEIAGAHATASTQARPLTLDGQSAITYQYRSTTPAGAKTQTRQVLVVHKGRLHVITLVAARAPFTGADTALGAMLATWRWTS